MFGWKIGTLFTVLSYKCILIVLSQHGNGVDSLMWLSVVLCASGRERLSGILGVSAEQASQFQDSFLQAYKDVQAFVQKTIQQCRQQGPCAFCFHSRYLQS